MKRSLLLLFSICTLFISFSIASAQELENIKPTVCVSGEGVATCVPDRAVISIGVLTKSEDATNAQQENARISSAIQNTLLEMGISDTDIQTKNYSFSPSYSSENGKRNQIIGYSVNNTVVVVVEDIKNIGKVIDYSLNNGANKVNSLSFSIKDSNPLRKEALKRAIKDAREKADIIASSLGTRITGIKTVSENIGSVGSRDYSYMMMNKSAGAETAISSGSLELRATVNIEFYIE